MGGERPPQIWATATFFPNRHSRQKLLKRHASVVGYLPPHPDGEKTTARMCRAFCQFTTWIWQLGARLARFSLPVWNGAVRGLCWGERSKRCFEKTWGQILRAPIPRNRFRTARGSDGSGASPWSACNRPQHGEPLRSKIGTSRLFAMPVRLAASFRQKFDKDSSVVNYRNAIEMWRNPESSVSGQSGSDTGPLFEYPP